MLFLTQKINHKSSIENACFWKFNATVFSEIRKIFGTPPSNVFPGTSHLKKYSEFRLLLSNNSRSHTHTSEVKIIRTVIPQMLSLEDVPIALTFIFVSDIKRYSN